MLFDLAVRIIQEHYKLSLRSQEKKNRLCFTARGSLRLVLESSRDSHRFALSGLLGSIPSSSHAHVLKTLLKANYLGARTQGATLALDPGSEEVVLFRFFYSHDFVEEEFIAEFEGFLDLLEYWKKEIEKECETDGESSKDSIPPGMRA